jgi:hypothetical protein
LKGNRLTSKPFCYKSQNYSLVVQKNQKIYLDVKKLKISKKIIFTPNSKLLLFYFENKISFDKHSACRINTLNYDNGKAKIKFWEIWNMSFGFLGIQFGFALQEGLCLEYFKR